MRSSVFWALVRKDLYLLRAFVVAGLAAGLIALVAMSFGKVGFAVGGILYLTANIACGIMIAMYSFVSERKEQSRLFALSLPIAGQRHDLAKLTAAFLTYGIPWSILTFVAVVLVPLSPAVPSGYIVYGLLLHGCFLALFGVLVAMMFVINSEALAALTIITTNVLFSLFMVMLNQPSVNGPITGPRIVWTPAAVRIISVELVVIVAAVTFAMVAVSRKRDHL
jgi:hypothetical protein